VLCIVPGSRLSAAQQQRHYLPAVLHALAIGGIVRVTDTVPSTVGLEVGVCSWRRAAHVCQFAVGEEDVLDGSVGVNHMRVDLAPDLEREGAEELGVILCVWRMAAEG
jgi:hypothetical protein